ncbi:hypothetical protein [Foetidibacter luteolus]|uniref:hypothetical protein n=1 Tax=Foetidibacter luteolus TaxID=2608880 RepID=UPI00129A6628|nr:hypothetical protein [Foetidibacter luteolus]
MKKKKNELDVDFIGGQGPLTMDEEAAISNYLKSVRDREAKERNRKIRTMSKQKANF